MKAVEKLLTCSLYAYHYYSSQLCNLPPSTTSFLPPTLG